MSAKAPTYLPVPRLKRLDFKWFWDQKLDLFESAKNTVEMRTRITWLSEGSLRYHLDPTKPHPPHGGCPDEKALFAKFLVAREDTIPTQHVKNQISTHAHRRLRPQR